MNTNTQKLVFSKIKKQDLGAIEDAINKAKQDLSNKFNEMVAIKRKLEAETSNVTQKAKSLADDLSTSMVEIGTNWNDRLDEFKEIANELDDLGIRYDYDIESLGSDYLEVYDQADTLMSNLGN